MKHDVGKHRS